jgi:hypothetical protein
MPAALPAEGFEPPTYGLQNRCTTTVLSRHTTPKGIGRVTMALHLTHKPFLVRLAPVITGVAVALATAAGLVGILSVGYRAARRGAGEAQEPL